MSTHVIRRWYTHPASLRGALSLLGSSVVRLVAYGWEGDVFVVHLEVWS